MLGYILLFALLIADIVRIFVDSDDFDGVMLLARPVATLLGVLLCGGTFWTALLWAVVWGILGMILALTLSEHFGNRLDTTPAEEEEEEDDEDEDEPADSPTPLPQPKTPPQPIAPVPEKPRLPAVPSGTFEFAPDILPDADRRYKKAKAADGTVYHRFSHGEKPIGYYEIRDGRVRIYRVFDKGLIGYTQGSEIYLTREALYQQECRLRSQYGNTAPTPTPCPMVLNLAELRDGVIKDNLNYDILGNFTGDALAAAAAFVCLIYECHTDYQYRLFYNWQP